MDRYSYIEHLTKLVRYGMMYAQHAHDYIFDEEVDNSIAVSHLNIAVAKFAAAESLYYSRIEVLENMETEEIFRLFDVFVHELLTNISTNHSHQWTDIEFRRLKSTFDDSVFAIQNHQ